MSGTHGGKTGQVDGRMGALKRAQVRNTSGLKANARRRAESTRLRVDDAIAVLLGDPSLPITFNTVATAAGVAKAYLYKEPPAVQVDLLGQQRDQARRQLAPVRDRADASTRLLVAAKDRRIRELEARVKQLEFELAACRGRLYDRL